MSQEEAILYSLYVIDGVQQELCPAELLATLCPKVEDNSSERDRATIIDESADPVVLSFDIPDKNLESYLAQVAQVQDDVPLAYSASYSRLAVAKALIDIIWQKGHFRIGNLSLNLSWNWSGKELGAMAAFYESVLNVVDYADALGLNIASYEYNECDKYHQFLAQAKLVSVEDENALINEPYKLPCPDISSARALPSELFYDPKSWLLFVPFDGAEPNLGGSAFARLCGLGGAAPHIEDADYFLDCYEVVREFVEDGILLSGATLSKGGLIAAAQSMCAKGVGIDLNISNLVGKGQSAAPLLYAEMPGVLLQIRDSDFDYVDAELLLQDVAYFPLGHPNDSGRLRIANEPEAGIQAILSSLMQYAEGED